MRLSDSEFRSLKCCVLRKAKLNDIDIGRIIADKLLYQTDDNFNFHPKELVLAYKNCFLFCF